MQLRGKAMITEIYIDPKRGCDWYTGEKPTSDCGNGALKTIGCAIQKNRQPAKDGRKIPDNSPAYAGRVLYR